MKLKDILDTVLEDIEKGVKIFMEIKEKSKSGENDDIENYMHMYS